ncbi:MAG: hypothetical protein DCC65_10695 [Planctomycetota bacterium]|nr:MAG: hypothetical protein DCC65_10695 [Planctomycetota bacterium]
MFSKKKPKKLDLGPVEDYLAAKPKSLDIGPPALPIVAKPTHDTRPFDREAYWRSLGPKAWQILQQRRLRTILDCDQICEFDRYLQVLHQQAPDFRDEIFIGIDPETHRPILVPRFVFERHSYILGGSGSGKTTHALAQILLQLSEAYTDQRGDLKKPPPILIIDMKQNGDRFLRALASQLASDRNQELRFYSNDPEYVSMVFDPLYSLRTIKYPLKLLETLLKAFSMIYPEGYGSDFFTAEQRLTFMRILYDQKPTSMKQLIGFIRKATRGQSAESKDARGLYAALAALEYAMHVHTDGSPIDPEQRVDFDRFFDRGEVMYVHLDSRALSLLSRDIGKLMLFSLLETASQRERHGRKVQCFVAIDEFHRLAARNIVEMLEDARSAGLGFIIAHQSSSSLKTRDADLYGSLFENCSFKQCLTLEDARVIELFRMISGRSKEYRASESTTTSKSNTSTRSEGVSESESFGHAGASMSVLGDDTLYEEPRWGNTVATSKTEGTSTGESKSQTKSLSEEMVCSLVPEVVTLVNHIPLLSLVHIKGTSGLSHTDTGGVPVLVQGMFPFMEKRFREMIGAPWPHKNVSQEEYYLDHRPKLEASQIRRAELGISPSTPLPTAKKEQDESPLGTDLPESDGELRQLKNQLRVMASRLSAQMLEEPARAVDLARRFQISIGKLIAVAADAGIVVKAGGDMLTPHQVNAIKFQIAKAGKDA